MLVLEKLKDSCDSIRIQVLSKLLIILLAMPLQVSQLFAAPDIIISGDSSDDIFATQIDQKIIYNSGSFTGRVVSGVSEEFAGHFIVNNDLQYTARLSTLDTVEVSSGADLSLSGRHSDTHSVILNQGASLTVEAGGATFAFKEMDGSAADTGTLNVNGNYSLFRGTYGRVDENIGATNRLAEINVGRGGSFWAYGQVNAAQINIDGLVVLGKPGDFDQIKLGESGTLMFVPGSINEANPGTRESSYDDNYNIINGDILATNDPSTQSNISNIHFSALWADESQKTFKINGSIGQENEKINQVYVTSGLTLDLTDSAGFYVENTGLYARQSNKKPQILLGSGIVDTQFAFQPGGIVGTIRVTEDHNLISSIGSGSSRFDRFEVDEDASVNVRNSIYTNWIQNNPDATIKVFANAQGSLNTLDTSTFVNYGTVDFSDASGSFNAMMTNFGGSTFHVGSNEVRANGYVDFAPGSTFSVDLKNAREVGSFKADMIGVHEGALLNINIANAHEFYNLQSYEYTIIESVNKSISNVNEIATSDISVNSVNGNEYGLLTFSTSESDSNLILNIERGDLPPSYNTNQSEVDNVINSIGSRSSGKLLEIQNYLILNPDVTNTDRARVLDSLTPKTESVSRAALSSIDSTFKSIESRMSSRQISRLINGRGYKTVDSNGNDVPEADPSSTAQTSLIYGNDFQIEKGLSKNVWLQAIGSKARQGDKNGFDGYKSSLQGLVVGIDKKTDKNTLTGISFSIANSKIETSDLLSSTQSDIYQLSIYQEKEFSKNKYYNLIAAIGSGRNDSNRVIPAAGVAANAKFSSYNYSLKGSLYNKITFENGLDLAPHIGLGYSANKIEDYQEQGAQEANLSVKTSDLQMLNGSIGIGVGYKKKISSLNLGLVKLDSFIIYPKLKISYEYDFLQDVQTSVSNFEGHDLTFTTRSSRTDPSTIKLSAGVALFGSEDLSFDVKYVQERRTAFVSHSAILETKLAF